MSLQRAVMVIDDTYDNDDTLLDSERGGGGGGGGGYSGGRGGGGTTGGSTSTNVPRASVIAGNSDSTTRNTNTSSGSSETQGNLTIDQNTGLLVNDDIPQNKPNRTDVSVEDYINYANTTVNPKFDMFGCYLRTTIKFTKPTEISDADAEPYFVNLLKGIFNIDASQASKIFAGYKSDALVINPSSIFINNFNVDADIFNPLYIRPADVTDAEHNLFTLNYSKNYDTGTYSLECYVYFRREYSFKSYNALEDKQINLINNDFIIKFLFINNDPNANTLIKYADIYRTLWVNVESYFPVTAVSLYIETKEIGKTVSIPITEGEYSIRTYNDEDTTINVHNLLSLKDEYNYLFIDNKDLNAINSDYFFNSTHIGNNKESTTFKFYLSDELIKRIFPDEDPKEAYKNIESINIYVTLDSDKIVEQGKAIATSNVFRVSTNTHATIDFVKNHIVYNSWNPKTTEESLIATFKLNEGEPDFGGNVSIFYGNQIVYPANDSKIGELENQSIITKKPDNSDYKNNVLYYDVLRKNEYLYVYLKTTKNEPFTFKKFVNVSLSDLRTYKNVSSNLTNINGIIAQNDVIVHNIDISIPQVSKGDNLVLIDNGINNKTKHYTYYSIIDNAYYGVKAIGYYYVDDNDECQVSYYDNELYKIGVPYLSYNVPAKIVRLYPEIEHRSIYSFKNGEQLIYLDKSSTTIAIDNNKIISTNHELLPNYRMSYDYIVNKTKPANTKTQYNFTFYPTKVFKDWVPASYVDIDNLSYYQKHIEYTLSYRVSNSTEYVLLSNSSANYPIYRNFDDIEDNNFYEYKYSEITNGDYEEDNIYEKVEEYVKIPANSISLETFKKVVKRSESLEYDNVKYYKYLSLSKTYVNYTYEEVENLEYIPLNIYVKYNYYLKRAKENINNFTAYKLNKSTSQTSLSFSSSVNEAADAINSGETYFMYVSDLTYTSYINGIAETSSYIPWKGLVRDGSANYYGYVLTRLDKSETNNRNNETNIDQYNYYVKQKYCKITNNAGTKWQLSKEDVDELRTNKVDLYVQEDNYAFGFEPIDNDYTIFNIDVSGNTIYAYDRDKYAILDIDKIRARYYNVLSDEFLSEFNRENILREESNSQYLLTNWDADGEGHNIKYIISLDGNYRKVNYLEEFSDDKREGDTYQLFSKYSFIFIKQDSYVMLEKIAGQVDLYPEMINALLKYNVQNKLYTPTLSKLGAEDLLKYDTKRLHMYEDPSGYKSRILFRFDGDNYRVVNENTGIIQGAKIFKYNQEYVPSYDLHTCIHKHYFEKLDIISYNGIYVTESNDVISKTDDSWTINSSYNWKGALHISQENVELNSNGVPTTSTAILTIKDSDVRFYEKGISEYKYYEPEPNNPNTAYHTINDLKTFYNSHQAYLDYYNTNEDSTYTFEIFYKSKFLYGNYSICDDIQIDTDGSYFVNVLTFDSHSGKISKKLTLNHHIYDVIKYTYAIEDEYFSTLDDDYDYNISTSEYGKYFVKENNKYVSLLETNNSLSYYLSHNEGIYTLQKSVSYNYYNNNSGDNQLGNPYTFEPEVIKKNDEFYGLIFEDNPGNKLTASTILFETAYNGTPDNPDDDGLGLKRYEITNTFDVISRKRINEFNPLDNEIAGHDNDVTDESVINDALVAANNELYYNNYTDFIKDEPIDLHINEIEFIPNKFKYDIVPLTHFTFRNYDSDNSIIQSKKILNNSITVNKPFSVSNEEKVNFTGTYNWIPPKYKNIINEDGINTYVIERDGYYEKSYTISKVPFNVTSYNYYPKDEISSINISYSFVPNSYIISSVIEHPKIAYEYMVNDTVDEARYSYIINGFEYDYTNVSVISYENGTYYGVIKLLDLEGESVDTKISLYKRNEISTKTSVKTITYQEPHISYEYFAYIQATPLTNEKIPVLYNTELIPATSTKVEFWNESKNSYQVKTVIDSYAYYSYKYKYETIPFKVASYIYTDDLGISNFPVLGAYIDHIADKLSDKIGYQSESIYNLTHDLSYIFKQTYIQNKEIADIHDLIYSSYSYIINNSLVDINKNVNESLSSFSNAVTDRITNLTAVEEAAMNAIEKSVTKEILEHKNIVNTVLTKESNILDSKLTTLNSTIHEDLIGDGASNEITTTYEKTTYTPVKNKRSGIVSSYTSKTESGSNTIEVGGKSIGEILTNTLGCVSKYTTTDTFEDGSYTVTTYDGFIGIGEILAHLSINKKLPDYKEFMVDLVPKLFANVDFEGDYDVEYDIFGHVKSRKKRNPNDIAKKCVMRGDILWKELKKKGIVS